MSDINNLAVERVTSDSKKAHKLIKNNEDLAKEIALFVTKVTEEAKAQGVKLSDHIRATLGKELGDRNAATFFVFLKQYQKNQQFLEKLKMEDMEKALGMRTLMSTCAKVLWKEKNRELAYLAASISSMCDKHIEDKCAVLSVKYHASKKETVEQGWAALIKEKKLPADTKSININENAVMYKTENSVKIGLKKTDEQTIGLAIEQIKKLIGSGCLVNVNISDAKSIAIVMKKMQESNMNYVLSDKAQQSLAQSSDESAKETLKQYKDKALKDIQCAIDRASKHSTHELNRFALGISKIDLETAKNKSAEMRNELINGFKEKPGAKTQDEHEAEVVALKGIEHKLGKYDEEFKKLADVVVAARKERDGILEKLKALDLKDMKGNALSEAIKLRCYMDAVSANLDDATNMLAKCFAEAKSCVVHIDMLEGKSKKQLPQKGALGALEEEYREQSKSGKGADTEKPGEAMLHAKKHSDEEQGDLLGMAPEAERQHDKKANAVVAPRAKP